MAKKLHYTILYMSDSDLRKTLVKNTDNIYKNIAF